MLTGPIAAHIIRDVTARSVGSALPDAPVVPDAPATPSVPRRWAAAQLTRLAVRLDAGTARGALARS
jgi:hypothetical protein